MGTRSTMDSARLIGALVLVALVIIFTLQNTETIGVDILFWELDASGAIFVFLNFAVGVVVGWFLRSRRQLSDFHPLREADEGID
jgi:uncharacterized integral membrane protein